MEYSQRIILYRHRQCAKEKNVGEKPPTTEGEMFRHVLPELYRTGGIICKFQYLGLKMGSISHSKKKNLHYLFCTEMELLIF